MSFKALQDACALTDGNFNRHLHALAEMEHRGASNACAAPGRPTTLVRITRPGRARFLAYIDELEAVVRAVQSSAREQAGTSFSRLATQA